MNSKMNAAIAETCTFLDNELEPIPGDYLLPIKTEGGDVPVYNLWTRFYESPYGQHMDSQPLRYAERHGYDRQQMIRDLGADVIPQFHQYETALYVSALLRKERQAGTIYELSDDDAAITMYAMSLHDMGETTHPEVEKAVGAVVGDIPYGQKTKEDKRVEAAIREYLFATLYADVDPKVIQRAESIINHSDQTLLHEYAEAAHTLQSYVTAMRARMAFEKGLQQILDHANPDVANHQTTDAMQALQRLEIDVVGSIGSHVENWKTTFLLPERIQQITRTAILAASHNTDESYYRYRQATRPGAPASKPRVVRI